MNSLSWLLYLGDVCESTKVVGVVLSITTAFIGACLVLMFVASEFELKPPMWVVRSLTITFVFAVLMTVIAPSQRTIYMIAASQAGEQVAQSETGKLVGDEVRKLILRKLQKLNEAAQ